MFWNTVKRDEVKKAKEEGYRQAEADMKKELDFLREESRRRERDLITSIEKRADQMLKERENQLALVIKDLKLENENLRKKRRDDIRAWLIFKEYVPEALKQVAILKGIKKIEAEETAREYHRYVQSESDLEGLHRIIEKISPKVEKLYNVEVGFVQKREDRAV